MRILCSALLLGLLGLGARPAGAAEPLGRLFMTPEQRQMLDAVREDGPDPLMDTASLALPAPAPVDGPVVLNGIVRRSRGPDVVWVNGARTGAPQAPVRLRQGPDRTNRVTLEVAADGASVRLKPGQFWEPATGTVANCYGCAIPAQPAADTPAPAEVTAGEP